MPTRKSVVLTLVSTIGILSACMPPPTPTCEPGQHCERSTIGPQLSPEQAQAQLADMLERYGSAAIDGLDARECDQLGELIQGFQALYERDASILVARFNVAAIHEACGRAM
jgi:hypothetical protein